MELVGYRKGARATDRADRSARVRAQHAEVAGRHPRRVPEQHQVVIVVPAPGELVARRHRKQRDHARWRRVVIGRRVLRIAKQVLASVQPIAQRIVGRLVFEGERPVRRLKWPNGMSTVSVNVSAASSPNAGSGLVRVSTNVSAYLS